MMRQNKCNKGGKFWLYLDMLLSAEEKEEFEEHLKACPHCKAALTEYSEAMELYKNNRIEEVSESEFEEALVNAVKSKKKRAAIPVLDTVWRALGFLIRHKMQAALGATVIIAAIAVSSLLKPPQKQSAVTQQPVTDQAILNWTDETRAQTAQEINTEIEYIAEDDIDKYMLQSYEDDELTLELYDLHKNIYAIADEIDVNNF